MGVIEWLHAQLTGKKSVEVSAETIEKYIDSQKMSELCATEFFILVAECMIANIISKCEFRTCMYGKEVKGEEYYTWNYEPNQNQSGCEFKKAIVSQLLKKNKCLIISVKKQLYVADSFLEEDENFMKEKVFSNVVVGTTSISQKFRMSEVIFIKLNNQNIRNLLNAVNEGYKKIAQNALEDYESAGGRKGTMHVDTTAMNKKYGERTFQEVYEDLLKNRFNRYFKEKNAVLPLFNGFEYKEQEGTKQSKSENKASDYKSMLNETAAKVGLAYNIPPKFMTGEVEGMQDATNLLLSICIDPISTNIETSINRSRYKKAVLEGCYLWIDTTSILHIDLFAVAEKVDKLIASGMCSIDELRQKARMLELGTEESTRHWITKNYRDIEKEGGGE